MPEYDVIQRSDDWFLLRSSVCITASNFGDAIGVGKGRPYDFLRYILEEKSQSQDNQFTKHGVQTEPIINEAYQLLTGNKTRSSGFWTLENDLDPLSGLIGASPDAVIFQTDCDENHWSSKDVGLAEYKAPFYRIYPNSVNHGIPLNYMAQIQGQMAICDMDFCDFMAICMNTKEITLKRVQRSRLYWDAITPYLKEFCLVLQEAQERQRCGLDMLNFPEAIQLSNRTATKHQVATNHITITDLIANRQQNQFSCNLSNNTFSFDFLVGKEYRFPSELSSQKDQLLKRIDNEITEKFTLLKSVKDRLKL